MLNSYVVVPLHDLANRLDPSEPWFGYLTVQEVQQALIGKDHEDRI